MEELKDKAGEDAVAEAGTGKWKSVLSRLPPLPKLPELSRRTLIIAAAADVAIAVLAGGAVAYRASAKV
ncbi:MAG: hypothetical protein QG638_555, partial [Pseudomonadota bacterium]|nr:hypothetical protein [Pseudomonadota bacterium]